MVVDMLGAILTGADAQSHRERAYGTFIWAVDVGAFRPRQDYEAAAATTLRRVKTVPPAPGFDEVLVPGEPEARSRHERSSGGIPIPEDTWAALADTATALGVDLATFR